MPTFIINSDLTATHDTPKPVRGTLGRADYRDKLIAWNHRNRYMLDSAFTDINDMPKLIGKRVEANLRQGILYVEKIIE